MPIGTLKVPFEIGKDPDKKLYNQYPRVTVNGKIISRKFPYFVDTSPEAQRAAEIKKIRALIYKFLREDPPEKKQDDYDEEFDTIEDYEYYQRGAGPNWENLEAINKEFFADRREEKRQNDEMNALYRDLKNIITQKCLEEIEKSEKERQKNKDKYTWVDIQDYLFSERILFLPRDINDESSINLISMMHFLDIEDSCKEMVLFINSMGGDLTAGFAIYDVMQRLISDISPVNLSVCASMATFILNGGTSIKRLSYPHAITVFHQLFVCIYRDKGFSSPIDDELNALLETYEEMLEIYSVRTGRLKEKIRAKLKKLNYMSAKQALEYGLIDRIVIPHRSSVKSEDEGANPKEREEINLEEINLDEELRRWRVEY